MRHRGTILFGALVAATAINAAYLAAFDSATIFYHANVVAHVLLGLALVVALAVGAGLRLAGRWESGAPRPVARTLFVLSSLVMCGTGLWLIRVGTARAQLPKLYVHIGASVAFLFALVLLARPAARLASSVAQATAGGGRLFRPAAGVLAASILIPATVRGYDWIRPAHVHTIANPALPPATMDGEGMGKDSHFFPSSNRTVGGKLIPSDFFLESKSCGNAGCHPDITKQWESSMHHFSSFNNQFYRKSIEYMQEVIGTKPSKWCGGCHDMAILLTGRMDTPIVEQIDTREAQAGIACLVCHSISHVSDTMGQGGFTLEYPEMHRLVASKNPFVNKMHDIMTVLDPAPHRATMLKPFHRTATAEFCSSCHKVHLDVPVNNYRWFRGFNDYDPWQGSGVSGQGARAFYYPPDGPKHCGSCHMPLVDSKDAGNINGKIHNHRFAAANTAVPVANKDKEQLEAVTKFLQNGILTVDIFAVSEDTAGEAPQAASAPAPAGTESDSGVGRAQEAAPVAHAMIPDEGGFGGGALAGIIPARDVVAPIERATAAARPGSTVRVDVVARTRKIGHFFPGGTVDAFDVWLELKAEDATGKVLYWNGWVADEGKGPVDPGAHFYRAVLVDEHGNRINKRNAWAGRAVAYARLIPPGAADTAHFRLTIPPDAQGPLKLTAKMNYRKFSWYYTNFSYAGMRDPSKPGPVDKGFDDAAFIFAADTSRVSGQVKEIPDLPAIVVAQDVKELALGEPVKPASDPKDRERWNDYGIGLLLQRDFKGAEAAFRKVTEIEPGYADGWVNRARVAIDEGDHKAAIGWLEEALKRDPALPKAHYFLGVALKSFGRYDESLEHLRKAHDAFPRDRVVSNAIGRILFLQRRFTESVGADQQALAVDPEDLTAHYNLMLVYRGLRDEEKAKAHEALYLRFKTEESAQSLTQAFRLLNPYDNRERQPIHAHDSTWTPESVAAASMYNNGRPKPLVAGAPGHAGPAGVAPAATAPGVPPKMTPGVISETTPRTPSDNGAVR